MSKLEKEYSSAFFKWVEELSYPFCTVEKVFKNSPKIKEVQSLENYFKKEETRKKETV